VLDRPRTTPPASPADGARYIVAARRHRRLGRLGSHHSLPGSMAPGSLPGCRPSSPTPCSSSPTTGIRGD